MAKPRHNYDGEEFYQEIYGYAFQGANDNEIADALDLSPEDFNSMKNGNCLFWDEEENERRGSRIRQALERARRKVNFIVRGRYLKAALGGIKIKSKTTVRRKMRIDGQYTEDEDIQTTENETETAPNIGALGHWLYHHDLEWRRVEKGLTNDDDSVQNVDTGIDISKWITKELNSKEKNID